MAKENTVILHGVALQDTAVKYDINQIPVRAILYVRAVDRANTETSEIQYTTLVVYSGNEQIIEAMAKVRKDNLVDVYGTITTASVTKKRTCPKCGTVNISEGNAEYVSPLYVCKRESGLSPEEIEKLLLERVEFSNRVTVIGNICVVPEYNDGNGESIPKLKYQLAVPRTIRVSDDTADRDTDYPWVLASGNQASEGRDALYVGSSVLIKGHLRTREQSKDIQCSACGEVFTARDFPIMRISPHFTEYLHNCNFPDARV